MDSEQSNTNSFIHSGIVSKMTDHSVIVSLSENVHCESCRAKGTCGVSDAVSKEIEVPISDLSFQLNETVSVQLKRQLGFQAVFWAYVFPFILVISTLIVCSVLPFPLMSCKGKSSKILKIILPLLPRISTSSK